jgi:hypothetical protein
MKKTAETIATFLIVLAAGGMLGYFLHHLFSQRVMYLNTFKDLFSKWSSFERQPFVSQTQEAWLSGN